MAPDLFSNKAWHAVSLAEVPFQCTLKHVLRKPDDGPVSRTRLF